MLHDGRIVEFDIHYDDQRNTLIEILAQRLTQVIEGLSLEDGQYAAATVVADLRDELQEATYYRELRAALQRTMADPDAWDDYDTRAGGLLKYVNHLAGAWHGDCDSCGRRIKAGEHAETIGRWRSGDPRLLCQECV
jgi:hypothetical protein